jgi:hypothetical protein
MTTVPRIPDGPRLPKAPGGKPSAWWFALAGFMIIGVPMIVGILMFSVFFKSFFSGFNSFPRSERFAMMVPGEKTLTIEHGGTYDLVYLPRAYVAGELLDGPTQFPGTDVVLVDPAGSPIALEPVVDLVPVSSSSSSSSYATTEVSLYRFDIPPREEGAHGVYQLRITTDDVGPPQRLGFEIEPVWEGEFPLGFPFGESFKMYPLMMIGGVLSNLCPLGGIAIIIVVAIKRTKAA